MVQFACVAALLGLLGACKGARGMSPDCGTSPTDWCTSSLSGDSCGRHGNETSCRADPKCKGMAYRGESVVACMPDGKGFWSNCPAVGCVSR